MNASARAVAIVIILGGVLVGCKQKEAAPSHQSPQASTRAVTPIATTAPAKMEWTLLPGLSINSYANNIDVSSDRKLAIFWGVQKVGSGSRESIWVIDLQTGQIDDLFVRIGGQNAAKLANIRHALFSQDGKHIAVSGKSGGIIELSTGKTAFIDDCGPTLAWAGNHLLCPAWDGHVDRIEAYDLSGQRVERLKVCGELLGSDITGERLLVKTNKNDPAMPPKLNEETVAVVTPNGKVLREIALANNICDKDTPLLSRQGNFAGAYCTGNPGFDDWCRRIVPMGDGESIYLPIGWGALAISETGGCLSMEGSDLRFWTRDGKCHDVADYVMAGTILGNEIFFIKAGATAILRAVPIPQSGPGIASLARFTELLAQERAAETQPSPTTAPAPKN